MRCAQEVTGTEFECREVTINARGDGWQQNHRFVGHLSQMRAPFEVCHRAVRVDLDLAYTCKTELKLLQ